MSNDVPLTDLDQRAARILESLTCDRCPACDNKYGTTPDQQWYCEGCGERWETSNEAADLVREQAAEIERLRARLRELEAPKGLAAFVRASPEERERIGNEVAKAAIEEQEKTLRDAGPTPLRGRVTRRDE